MNLRSVVGFAISMLLLVVLSHSMTNSVFAQTVSGDHNTVTGMPSTGTGSDLKSQMQTAKDTSKAGMKTVTDKMKTEKGLKNKLKTGMSTSKDVMKSQMQTVIPSDTPGAQAAKDDLKSQMQTAKDTSKAGMKKVKDKTKS